MRVPEFVRKSVVYLGGKTAAGRFEPYGTGFLVVWYEGDVGFPYIVTAKHVLDDVKNAKPAMTLTMRVNDKNGSAQTGSLANSVWAILEPDLDIAVTPVNVSLDSFDVDYVPLNTVCLEPKYIEENDIGCGEEVATVGLLLRHAGKEKNLPIVRTGNIAAMMEEPVDLEEMGHQYVYLIESRSIGGLSGSPVFLNTPPWRVVRGVAKPMADHKPVYLMGVNLGLFEVSATRDKAPSEPKTPRENFLERMSAGIAIVMPIQRVLGIIHHTPWLVEMRKNTLLERQKNSGFVKNSAGAAPVVVSATDDDQGQTNPRHKEAFKSLLSAAVKTKQQDG